MSEQEEDFASMFEASVKARRFNRGQTIEGTIVGLGPKVAFVDVGGKGEADIDMAELKDASGKDVIRAYVKGAPDQLMDRAAFAHGADGTEVPIDYRLLKTLWAFSEDRIAVRFEYESRDAEGQWWRSHGNEMWQFAADGLMSQRYASITDEPIDASQRRLGETGA